MLGKQPDLVKQAVHGLLKLDNASDESARASDENSISEGQQRLLPGRLLAQVITSINNLYNTEFFA